MVIGIPAGFENFVEELGILVTDKSNFTPPSGPFDIDSIVEISRNHGITFVPAMKKASDGGLAMS